MIDTACDLQLASTLDILHPRCTDTPDWRCCDLTLRRHGTHADICLAVLVRGACDDADAHHLANCLAFSAALERVFLDIIAHSPLAPAVSSQPITRWGACSHAWSRAGARLDYYTFPLTFADALAALSAHDRRALQRAGERVAAREYARRHG